MPVWYWLVVCVVFVREVVKWYTTCTASVWYFLPHMVYWYTVLTTASIVTFTTERLNPMLYTCHDFFVSLGSLCNFGNIYICFILYYQPIF